MTTDTRPGRNPVPGKDTPLRYVALSTALGVLYLAYRGRYPYCVSWDGPEGLAAFARAVGLVPPRPSTTIPAGLDPVRRALTERRDYRGPVGLVGLTAFQRAVLEKTRTIPRGETWTYGRLAAAVGHPLAARAVGSALAMNPLPLLIPCHRVVAAGARLGRYSDGGPLMKRRLLAEEGVDVGRLR